MVPALSPDTVTDVAGGDPVTVVAVFAVVPTNGVTVYLVMVLPPLFGAVQVTDAEELWAVATTLVAVPDNSNGVSFIVPLPKSCNFEVGYNQWLWGRSARRYREPFLSLGTRF